MADDEFNADELLRRFTEDQESAVSMGDLARPLAAFYLGLVENGCPEPVAVHLTTTLLSEQIRAALRIDER